MLLLLTKKKKKNDKKINKKIAELIATDISKKYFNKKLLFWVSKDWND